MIFQQYRRAVRCYLSIYLECENYLRAGMDLKASFLHLINKIFCQRSSKLIMSQWRGFGVKFYVYIHMYIHLERLSKPFFRFSKIYNSKNVMNFIVHLWLSKLYVFNDFRILQRCPYLVLFLMLVSYDCSFFSSFPSRFIQFY